MTTSEPFPRSLRIPDELWFPFLELVPQVEHTGASAQLRKMIQTYLANYKVFWAPEHPDIDPQKQSIAWYECDECNDVHRLSGKGAPWGCSVVKAHDDRLKKAQVA
jgi:hypothetical protein